MQDILDRLTALAEGPRQAAPAYIRVYQFEGDRAPDGIVEQFVQEYEQIVQFVSAHWGPPAFEGTWEMPGFPEWHHWVARLAYWHRNDRQIYIACDQPNPEMPIFIAIGVRNN